jgi:5-(carboxyamino)imidazole ribonucleotide synthase
LSELESALQELGTPAVLKTAGWGYDGKGQKKINSLSEAASAWAALGTTEAVLEGFVNFRLEVSVVAARGLDGSFASFGLLENAHSNHILDVTVAPARRKWRRKRNRLLAEFSNHSTLSACFASKCFSPRTTR